AHPVEKPMTLASFAPRQLTRCWLLVTLCCSACASAPDQKSSPDAGLPTTGAGAGTSAQVGSDASAVGSGATHSSGGHDAGSSDAADAGALGDAALPGDAALTTDASLDASVLPAPLTPFATHGAAITAPDGTWTWVDFPDAFCRDGSTAGIAVSLKPSSDKLMIFLQGGGACFDGLTCAANPANANGQKAELTAGIFSRGNAANPLRDWNYVFVPYCTGDVHAGTNPSGMVPGVFGTQKFVGYLNMQAYLQRIVPSFPNVHEVLLTGISAGGFGAAANAVLVQRAFPNIRVKLIDDSGPPLAAPYLPACLQQKWRDLWGLEKSMLADCGAGCPNHDAFVEDYAHAMIKIFDDRPSGLIESAQDGTISGFFGAGQNSCTGVALLTPIPGATFQQGVLEFRDSVKSYPNFATYYPPGTQHTWLADSSFYTGNVNGMTLVSWVTSIVHGQAASNVGP
ncbi:MAG TPA: pectin acetylesterase-family hydrolase, partial [Polyangiales bacterium]